VDFETFYFDRSFDDLVSFEIGSYGFAMDNLVFFDVVPEPSPVQLLCVGATMFSFFRRLKKRDKLAQPHRGGGGLAP